MRWAKENIRCQEGWWTQIRQNQRCCICICCDWRNAKLRQWRGMWRRCGKVERRGSGGTCNCHAIALRSSSAYGSTEVRLPSACFVLPALLVTGSERGFQTGTVRRHVMTGDTRLTFSRSSPRLSSAREFQYHRIDGRFMSQLALGVYLRP